MASLRDLRRRIRSVRNTQKITNAMKLVSGARLRRAQDAILAARPYARKLQEVLSDLAARARPGLHALLAEGAPAAAVDLVVVTGDKGLCGSFNSNAVKRALVFARERGDGGLRGLHLIGRKGRDLLRRRNLPILSERVDQFRGLNHERASGIARQLCERFTSGATGAVYVVYNEFKSIAQQRVILERLLPIERAAFAAHRQPPDCLYEPAAEELFARLLPLHVDFQVYRVLLESNAAEQAARMGAMDAATRNASDMIGDLTLHLNRVRQASITKELIEVISGADALA